MITVGSRTKEAQLEAVAALLANGTLRLYAGQRPATPDAAAASHLMLAELRIASEHVEISDDGCCHAGPIKGLVTGAGRATWLRVLSSKGRSVLDGDVGVANGDLHLTRVDFLPGDTVTIPVIVVDLIKHDLIKHA